MLKMEFCGTVKEVMDEVKEFVGLSDTKIVVQEMKVDDVGKLKEKIDEKAKEVVESTPTLPTATVNEQVREEKPAPVLPTIPTKAVEYKIEDLQKIVKGLLDKDMSKREDLQRLLNEGYGLKTILDLPVESYGAFIQDLKGLGADV